jgi:catechol-2,3-dioxygenase
MTVNAVRLNHAVLFVADLERSITFYSEAFGMTVMAREPRANAAFLRLPRSGNHHDLGLFGVGAQPPRPRGSLGLYHLAWQVDTIEELEQARLTLANLEAYTGESSHGATKSVYAHDPDDNAFEVMWMLPKAEWGAYENSAPIDRLDLAGEVRRWSGIRTAAELVPVETR